MVQLAEGGVQRASVDILKYLGPATITNQSDVLSLRSQSISPYFNSLQNNSHVELRIDTNIIFKNIIGALLSHSRLLHHVWNLLLLHPQFSHTERGAGDNDPPGSQTQKEGKRKKLKPPLFISKLTSQNYKSTVLQLQQE